jgi:hypothetical protein
VGAWTIGSFAFFQNQVCKILKIVSRNTVAVVIGKGIPSTPVACSELRRIKMTKC